MKQQQKFVPILLGSDINVYGMARSFHEQYGIKPKVYGSYQLSATRFSSIIDMTIIPGLSEDPVFINAMRDVQKVHSDPKTKYLLIACGDAYAELVSKHKPELSKHFEVPYIEHALLEKLVNKQKFYEVCEQYNLPYPKTLVITKKMAAAKKPVALPFAFPVALKPADSVAWLSINFEGKKKAFRILSRSEFDALIQKIYAAGYTKDMIAQDFIPGDDSYMRVMNAYVDQNHTVRMMALGHPLLEDPSPASIGNYMAILPDHNKKIYQRIKTFLETINYTGFANFDMKYDERDGEYKIFEINPRQGRSSFYVTLMGNNLAKYVVEDRIFNKPFTKTEYADGDTLWLGVPADILEKYANEGEAKTRALRYIKQGKTGTTVFYRGDRSWVHHLYMRYMFSRYNGQYKRYFKENKG